jgi:NAD(P)-dependent dehydrogenase (short-subunit alcohol dehydrogenase family)
MALMLDLSGQVAIVTGGGTGIGLATAIELAKAGADIVVCSRKMEHLERAVGQVTSASDRRCIAIPTDIRKPEDIDTVVEKTVAEFSHIDILVNNAGGGFKATIEQVTPNGWDAVLNTNLKGTFLFCQAVGKVMVQQKKGNIINIASLSGRDGGPVHYAASKAGIINLTRSLAGEWAKHNIRVNCIAPGPVWVEGFFEILKKSGLTEPPKSPFALGRWGEPAEIAKIVVFLASDASSFILGETIYACGGPVSRDLIDL